MIRLSPFPVGKYPGIFLVMLLTLDLLAPLSSPNGGQAMGIVARIESSYARVAAYQTETDVSEYRQGKIVETKRFLYTFKKPDHIRIDMESPHRGMILVYPDSKGKVFVQPGGWTGFLAFHLSPESALLRSSAGQRIDQTDLGLLIRNMAHSLTDHRRGEIRVTEQEGQVIIEVLAQDHFLAGVLTLYRFFVNETLWLPVKVEEFTPDGTPKRKVTFRNLRTPVAVPDHLFRIDGEEPRDDRLGR
jgi:outer membrane lipoprotein-sorting protein